MMHFVWHIWLPGNALTLLAALGLDAVFGYPAWAQRRFRHPVQWMGALIAVLDRRWNCQAASPVLRRLLGIAALAVLLAAVLILAVIILRGLMLLAPVWGAALLCAPLVAAFIAQRSLYEHVARVEGGLRQDGLAGGRREVAMIVGRDVNALDETGVARAAIESLAENFSDGVAAPAVWCLLGGLPGIAAYKAVNTADSMIGHLSPRHAAFGWAAARLDDLINLPASRLAGLCIALAAGGEGRRAAFQAMARDAGKHRSPNAGWPEAAMAGALHLRLAGPRLYGGVLVPDAWMGQGRADAGADDIGRALAVFRRACLVLAALTGGAGAAIMLAAFP